MPAFSVCALPSPPLSLDPKLPCLLRPVKPVESALISVTASSREEVLALFPPVALLANARVRVARPQSSLLLLLPPKPAPALHHLALVSALMRLIASYLVVENVYGVPVDSSESVSNRLACNIQMSLCFENKENTQEGEIHENKQPAKKG